LIGSRIKDDDAVSEDAASDNLVELKRHIINTKRTVGKINMLATAKENFTVYVNSLEHKLNQPVDET